MDRQPPVDRPPVDQPPVRHIEEQCTECGAPLAPGTRACSVCGAPQPPRLRRGRSVADPRPARRRRPWWVPAGIASGAVAAVVGGALIGVVMLGDPAPDLAAASGTASPSPSTSVEASPTVEGSPTVDGPPTESPAPSVASPQGPAATPVAEAPVIRNRGIAEVVTASLNLREAGNREASILAVLKEGQRLFIIGAPAESGDLRWYRVATVDDPACGDVCGLIGFVATPRAEDDAWLTGVELDCPTSPMTAEAIAPLIPLEALSCYGREEITITGTMDFPMHGGYSPLRLRPAWLATDFSQPYMRQAWWIAFRSHPDARLDPPRAGLIVRATGHFEHPAATDCRASVDADFFGGEIPRDFEAPSPARVILNCRASFAWTGYEVIGSEVLPEAVAPLANETPSDADPLDVGQTVEVQTDGMQPDAEMPCITEYGPIGLGRTAWWHFAGTGAEVTIDTSGSGFDTVLGLYAEDSEGALYQVGCVDDVDGSLQARITAPTEAERTYWIQVGGYGGHSGTLRLTLQ
jgi:hypothetical protein